MRTHIAKLIYIFLLVIFGTAPSLAQSDAEAEPSKTILVFDASGSMWGQVDGESKITIARSVLQTMLETWQPQNELGLIAYGHRRKGDCSDIEQIIAPGPVDAKAFNAAINGLNPKGKTPLSAAVKQAAEILKYEENKATVILVTDGLETCNVDPCAMANELEKLGVDFTTHVVGFDLSDEEAKALQCIAENTGGQYFVASNASELNTAMQVVSKAAIEEYNLLLRGKVRKISEDLTDGVSWEVYAYQDGKLAEKYYTYSYKAWASFTLPVGKYRIKGVYGEATVFQDVEVKDDGVTEEIILFGTGTLLVRGRTGPNSQVAVGKEWNIFAIVNGKVSDKYLTYSYSSPAKFELPAGKYRIKGMYGKATIFEDVEVKADETNEVTVVFDTGTLLVSGLASASSQDPVGKEWNVFAINDGQVADRYLTYSYGASARFDLPVGTYRIKAMYGEATMFDDVEVKADQSTQVTIVFNTGRLLLSGRAKGNSQTPVGKEWNIFAITDGQIADRYLTYSYSASPSFDLPAGKYRIKGIYDAKSYTRDVVIVAGEKQTIVMQFE
ncbi:MAG: VWA domain-containing protein [Robiginitomaculum sp.]|nr:VWA domain-containing protein [Robiginitomaculum sp.]